MVQDGRMSLFRSLQGTGREPLVRQHLFSKESNGRDLSLDPAGHSEQRALWGGLERRPVGPATGMRRPGGRGLAPWTPWSPTPVLTEQLAELGQFGSSTPRWVTIREQLAGLGNNSGAARRAG